MAVRPVPGEVPSQGEENFKEGNRIWLSHPSFFCALISIIDSLLSVIQKPRGLKAMGSMESDSERD